MVNRHMSAPHLHPPAMIRAVPVVIIVLLLVWAVLATMAMNKAKEDNGTERAAYVDSVNAATVASDLRVKAFYDTLAAKDRLAATLAQQSQDRLANPTTPEGLPVYTAPTLSTPTEQGFWEKLLGPVTAAGGAYTGLQPTTQAPGARSITGGR